MILVLGLLDERVYRIYDLTVRYVWFWGFRVKGFIGYMISLCFGVDLFSLYSGVPCTGNPEVSFGMFSRLNAAKGLRDRPSLLQAGGWVASGFRAS